MRTFYITIAIVLLWVTWQLHRPIPKQAQVARAFTDSEIDYLEKSFDYAMDNVKAGGHLDWSAAGVNGRIAAGNPYQSTQKARCRNYIEISRTFDAQKVDSGIACKRSGKDGWCRVHGKDPQSCALEVAESSAIKRARFAILQGNQMIDDGMSKRLNIDTSRLIPSMPDVSAPNMPSFDMPDFEKPDISLRPPMPWDSPSK